MNQFNIRVYGIIVHNNKLLVLEEPYAGETLWKLPGGGLEFGEGTIECLKRELKEELNLELGSAEHFYTQDFFQESRFRKDEQILLIYYLAQIENIKELKQLDSEIIKIHWLKLNEETAEKLNLPIDKLVIKKYWNQINSPASK